MGGTNHRIPPGRHQGDSSEEGVPEDRSARVGKSLDGECWGIRLEAWRGRLESHESSEAGEWQEGQEERESLRLLSTPTANETAE